MSKEKTVLEQDVINRIQKALDEKEPQKAMNILNFNEDIIRSNVYNEGMELIKNYDKGEQS